MGGDRKTPGAQARRRPGRAVVKARRPRSGPGVFAGAATCNPGFCDHAALIQQRINHENRQGAARQPPRFRRGTSPSRRTTKAGAWVACHAADARCRAADLRPGPTVHDGGAPARRKHTTTNAKLDGVRPGGCGGRASDSLPTYRPLHIILCGHTRIRHACLSTRWLMPATGNRQNEFKKMEMAALVQLGRDSIGLHRQVTSSSN